MNFLYAAFALGYALLGLWILWIGREGPLPFCVVMGLLFLSLAVLRGFDAAGGKKIKEDEP